MKRHVVTNRSKKVSNHLLVGQSPRRHAVQCVLIPGQKNGKLSLFSDTSRQGQAPPAARSDGSTRTCQNARSQGRE